MDFKVAGTSEFVTAISWTQATVSPHRACWRTDKEHVKHILEMLISTGDAPDEMTSSHHIGPMKDPGCQDR